MKANEKVIQGQKGWPDLELHNYNWLWICCLKAKWPTFTALISNWVKSVFRLAMKHFTLTFSRLLSFPPPLSFSVIHSLTHSFTHSFTHSLIVTQYSNALEWAFSLFKKSKTKLINCLYYDVLFLSHSLSHPLSLSLSSQSKPFTYLLTDLILKWKSESKMSRIKTSEIKHKNVGIHRIILFLSFSWLSQSLSLVLSLSFTQLLTNSLTY